LTVDLIAAGTAEELVPDLAARAHPLAVVFEEVLAAQAAENVFATPPLDEVWAGGANESVADVGAEAGIIQGGADGALNLQGEGPPRPTSARSPSSRVTTLLALESLTKLLSLGRAKIPPRSLTCSLR
jgi:hypothetical protein